MEKLKLCPEHKSTYTAFCISKTCAKRLACLKCILPHSKTCFGNFVYFEDVCSENLIALFETKALSSVISSAEASQIIKVITPTIVQKEVSNMTAAFLDSVSASVSKLEHMVGKHFEKSKAYDESSEKVKTTLGFYEAKKTVFSNCVDQNGLETIALIKDQDNIVNKLKQLRTEFSDKIRLRSQLEFIQKKLEEVQKIVEKKLTFNLEEEVKKDLNICVPFGKDLQFEPTSIWSSQWLENNNTLLKTKNKVNFINLIDLVMPPDSGIYRWTIRILDSKDLLVGLLFELNEIFSDIGICDLNSYSENFPMPDSEPYRYKVNYRGKDAHLFCAKHEIKIQKKGTINEFFSFPEYTDIIYDSYLGVVTFQQNSETLSSIEVDKNRTYVPFIVARMWKISVEISHL